jgi:DNA-directed RNA polymerase subunit beta
MPNEKRAIRSRLDFSKIPTATQIPNLIEVQRRSYERFLQMDKLPNERDDSGLAVGVCVGVSDHRLSRHLAAGLR